jgi:hypothetical protein
LKTNKSKAKPGSGPAVDVLLSYADYAHRYGIHLEVAKRKIRESGIPIIRLNRKLVRVRLSDVLAIEQAAISTPPKHFQSRFPNREEVV